MMGMLAKKAGGHTGGQGGGRDGGQGEGLGGGPGEGDKGLIQLRDHPSYAKYFKMLKGNIVLYHYDYHQCFCHEY